MSTFHKTKAIATPKPSTTSIVLSSLLSNQIEKKDKDVNNNNELVSIHTGTIPHIPECKWWMKHYGLSPVGSYAGVSYHVPTQASHVMISSLNSNPISALAFPPGNNTASNNTIASANGPRVSLYSNNLSRVILMDKAREAGGMEGGEGNKNRMVDVKADKTIPAPAPIHALSYRNDGRLLAIGGEEGLLRVCDTNTRSVLRTFGGGAKSGRSGAGVATGTVRALVWCRDGKHLISGGDDGMIRMWNIGNEDGGEPVKVFRGHGDAVRCLAIVQLPDKALTASAKKQKELFPQRKLPVEPKKYALVSGSYDHTIRVWELNTNEDDNNNNNDKDACLAVIHHGAPVEALLPLHSALVVSAGGSSIKLWCIKTGTLLRQNDSNHSKTITSLCLARNCGVDSDSTNTKGNTIKYARLLSAGLDGFIRIYDPTTFQCLHGHKVNSPILSLAMSPDNSRLVIGSSDGVLSVRTRVKPKALVAADAMDVEEPYLRNGSRAYFTRGGSSTKRDPEDHTVQRIRQDRLSKFDKSLKKFEHGKALDEALATKNPASVSAILEELGKRRMGLETALSNRDEETLEPILAFTARYITQPQYSILLIGVANLLCDIYGPVLGQSAVIDELFHKLRRHVKSELRVHKDLMLLVGQIDGVLSAAEMLSRV